VIALGEGRGRLIGDSQWTNTSRSYDTARLYYRLPGARIEVLMVSVVKILADKFNVPDLGDRVWGTYDTFTQIIPKGTVDFYVLRHDQNRPGGFTGIGNLGTNTLGGRAEGPLPARSSIADMRGSAAYRARFTWACRSIWKWNTSTPPAAGTRPRATVPSTSSTPPTTTGLAVPICLAGGTYTTCGP
jgi:hypothetical protein